MDTSVLDVTRFDQLAPEMENRMQALVGPEGAWKERRDHQVMLLNKLGVTPGMRFLDLGCGVMRLGLPMIQYLEPGNYTGIDIDPKCIAAAHEMIEHFQVQDRNPRIIHSQSFGIEELGGKETFDRIWSYQVFIHLDDTLVRKGMAAIRDLLSPGGVAYLTVVTRDDLETLIQPGSWRGFPVSRAPIEYYESVATEAGLAFEAVGETNKTGWRPGRRPPKPPAVMAKNPRRLMLLALRHPS